MVINGIGHARYARFQFMCENIPGNVAPNFVVICAMATRTGSDAKYLWEKGIGRKHPGCRLV